jgi:hypothetical protein
MKAIVVRALTATGALALAFAVGHSARPAVAVSVAASGCAVHLAPSKPTEPTPMARGQLVAV